MMSCLTARSAAGREVVMPAVTARRARRARNRVCATRSPDSPRCATSSRPALRCRPRLPTRTSRRCPARQCCSSPARQFPHVRQEFTMQPAHPSPTLNLVTSAPTAATACYLVPHHQWVGLRAPMPTHGDVGWQIPAQAMLMSTSAGPTGRRSMVPGSRRPSGERATMAAADQWSLLPSCGAI